MVDNAVLVNYGSQMPRILKSTVFDIWMKRLKDPQAKARILVRIDRLRLGNAGDSKGVGEGISELRIDYGPGYRVYFAKRRSEIILLLCGGDKTTQSVDIERAKRLASEWSSE